MRNVLASSHSWVSLLHCTVASAVMSSDWQIEHTGVDRVATRWTVRTGVPGASTASNGLRSNVSFMYPRPRINQLARDQNNAAAARVISGIFGSVDDA
jgi:hypothetical protein